MRTAKPDSLLPALVVSLFSFAVCWVLFVALIELSGMYVGWFELFRPRWYQDAAAAIGAAALSGLSLWTIAVRFKKRDT